MRANSFNTENREGYKYRERLKEFLKFRGVLTEYKKGLKQEGYFCKDIDMIGFPDSIHPREMIMSFNWNATYEGFAYWSKINIEWLEYIGIFGDNYTSEQYWVAKEEYISFKTALKELGILVDVYSSIEEAFDTANEDLGCYTEEYIIRTLLSGHSYYAVLEIWIGVSDLFKNSEKGKKLRSLCYTLSQMNSDPKFKAKALCEYVRGAK